MPGGVGEALVSDEHILQLLRRLYMQQLQAGASGQTNSPNGGCHHRPANQQRHRYLVCWESYIQ
jgi:hypothetical protein